MDDYFYNVSYFLLMISLVITGCDLGGKVPNPAVQTRILDVRVEPNPAIMGESVKFTCIIEDSLDTRFKFHWSLEDAKGPLFLTTENNQVTWTAPDSADVYIRRVTADNGNENAHTPNKGFTVTVTAD